MVKLDHILLQVREMSLSSLLLLQLKSYFILLLLANESEAHPAMLLVDTLLDRVRLERPRRDPSRDCRKLSEG